MFEYLKPQYTTINRKRHFSFDGEIYPSVTSILSATKPAKDRRALQQWRKRVGVKQAQEISTKAARRGTSVHSAIKYFLREQPVPEDIKVNPFWHSIKPVLTQLDRVHLVESAIYHAEDGYAGCYDCLGEWEGQLCVFDWKTSSKPKKIEWINDYCLQVAAYVNAINYFYRVEIKRGIIAIALRDRPAQIFSLDVSEIDNYKQQFLTRLALFSLGAKTV